MKLLGVVRRLDAAGRVTLPRDIRRRWGIEHNDGLEIAVEGNYIILSKYRPVCIFCGGAEGIAEIKGKQVCEECLVGLEQPR